MGFTDEMLSLEGINGREKADSMAFGLVFSLSFLCFAIATSSNENHFDLKLFLSRPVRDSHASTSLCEHITAASKNID